MFAERFGKSVYAKVGSDTFEVVIAAVDAFEVSEYLFRYGTPHHALYYLALPLAFIGHLGIMTWLKKVRQKWAMDDLEERRKKSGNKANERSRQKRHKHMK